MLVILLLMITISRYFWSKNWKYFFSILLNNDADIVISSPRWYIEREVIVSLPIISGGCEYMRVSFMLAKDFLLRIFKSENLIKMFIKYDNFSFRLFCPYHLGYRLVALFFLSILFTLPHLSNFLGVSLTTRENFLHVFARSHVYRFF